MTPPCVAQPSTMSILPAGSACTLVQLAAHISICVGAVVLSWCQPVPLDGDGAVSKGSLERDAHEAVGAVGDAHLTL